MKIGGRSLTVPPAGDFPDSFQAVAYNIFRYPRRRFLVGQRERHHAESVKPVRMGFQYPAQFCRGSPTCGIQLDPIGRKYPPNF
ncbi:MAG: hypothetical protein PHE09_18470 [Oscillospiraceae bacterium]|nr:hypothetical protein [Oscillospiraceae bacterium]